MPRSLTVDLQAGAYLGEGILSTLRVAVAIVLVAATPQFACAEITVTLIGSGGGPNIYLGRWDGHDDY